MPTYFFNIYNDKTIIDSEGTDLTDLRAAVSFAILSARSSAADDVLRGLFKCQNRVEIVSDDGSLLHTVRFDDAVEVCS